MNIQLHRSINRCRFRGNERHPYGQTFNCGNSISVRCLLPTHPYVVSSTCRVERDNWHNRIHHAEVRYVATNHGDVLEYGITACGAFLTNPLYSDTAVRLCDCGKGGATICPRCELAVHPEYLHRPCAVERVHAVPA